MAEKEKEIVLINKSKSKLTINFRKEFPMNKYALKGGKLYLTEREYEWLQMNHPNLLEGEGKRLFREDELTVEADVLSDEEFFKQSQKKIKSAIAEMGTEEVESRYRYAQLQEEFPKAIQKALEDRILELDKEV